MAVERKTWFVRSGRNAQGPMSSAELAQMARAGILGPEAEISQAEVGPWRPARHLRGLVFPEPELPPLEDPEPFNSFADPLTPTAPQDAGILLEATGPRPIVGEPPDEDLTISVEAVEGPPEPSPRPPRYRRLTVCGWIARIAGVSAFAAGLALLGLAAMTFARPPDAVEDVQFLVRAGGGGGLVLFGLSLFALGELLGAIADLARNAWRQRNASQRTVDLLERLVSRAEESGPVETTDDAARGGP